MPGSNLASERGQALVWPLWAALCRRKRSHGVALVGGNPLKLRGFDLTPEEPHPASRGAALLKGLLGRAELTVNRL